MNALLRNLVYLSLITGVVFFFSCKKTTENKLEGTWKMINISNVNDTLNVERWNFVSDGTLNIFNDVNGVTAIIPRFVLHYEVKSYRKLIIEPIDNALVIAYCHEWKIAKLKKDVLVMTYESGGIVQKEFVKM